jgi:hypothetical protein
VITPHDITVRVASIPQGGTVTCVGRWAFPQPVRRREDRSGRNPVLADPMAGLGRGGGDGPAAFSDVTVTPHDFRVVWAP